MSDDAPRIQSTWVPLDLIDHDNDRIRSVEPGHAEMLAADLVKGIELPPILLRPALPPEVREGTRFSLVYGAHRVEAHRLVCRKVIRADIEDMSRAEAKIREAEENLKHRGLNPLDRGLSLRARKLAWEELYPETAHGRAPKSLKNREEEKSQTLRLFRPGRYSAETAERLGFSERTVQAAIEMAAKLAPSVIPILRTTSLVNNAAELCRLAEQRAEDQIAVAELVARGEANTVEQALIKLGLEAPSATDPDERRVNKIIDLASRLPKRDLRRIYEHIGRVLAASREGAR